MHSKNDVIGKFFHIFIIVSLYTKQGRNFFNLINKMNISNALNCSKKHHLFKNIFVFFLCFLPSQHQSTYSLSFYFTPNITKAHLISMHLKRNSRGTCHIYAIAIYQQKQTYQKMANEAHTLFI